MALTPEMVGTMRQKSYDLHPIESYYSELDTLPFVRNNAEYAHIQDHIRREMVHRLRSYCMGNHFEQPHIVSIRIPATPWQHVKEAYFAKWLKLRFPVVYRYETRKVTTMNYYLCPHADVKVDMRNGRNVHFAFMDNGPARY